ncbi:D-alanyl-D-alanine carboxypeptidase family protein [Shinella zoogloeoides]|uniref:Uncharacterized protein n=1 Tax=Shinella zoogloeoides TaxID=352475 RepID=A0A6N8T7X9_SHIZO|nr:D-alanyl-D-alanine carboxypeptidase family protein [Shinella zoogloeoides]MXN98670.1 hypothetical protein [Shinella zoogloeoides]UEX83123.1 D-alanyl-D-alanine carboxypeptidase family protein [Shinella zoogloeoides]
MAGNNKYLLNRDGRYFARIVIPKDLRSFLDNKTELRAPLGADRRTAQARLHTAVAELQARIAIAERRKALANGEAITPGRYPLPVDKIALRNYNERLAFDDELRNSGPRYSSVMIDDLHVALLRDGIAGKALASVNIRSATDDPAGYLSNALASDKARSHIDGMADAFASKLAKMLASMPDDLKGSVTINSGYRSVERQQQLWLDALKKYGSPEAARKWVAPPGNSQHNKGNGADLGYSSDRARQWAHQNAGSFGLSFPLANENWHIEDADARSGQIAAEIDRLTEAATRQADAYSQITAGAREYTQAQQGERQALTMSAQKAAAFRYEQELLAEAQRAGIQLSPQQRQEIAQLAQGMVQATTATEGLREKQEAMAEAGRFFGTTITDALTGLITGTMTWQQALQSVLQSLVKVALQAALLGEGPLAGLFGGGGSSGGGGGGFGGLLGSLLGGLFGFESGGYTGDGNKGEPAGVVHRGEFVMSKKAVERIGLGNLDAMHRGALRGGYEAGGFAGTAPAIRRPDLLPANGNAAPSSSQQISISAPVTVNASGGTPEQNADLAKHVSREIEATMRGVVISELQQQMRPGNLLSAGRGR